MHRHQLLHSISFRVKSRVLLIPFDLPSTGPTKDEEYKQFEEFEEKLHNHHYSSAVGWLVKLRLLLLSEGKSFVEEMKTELHDVFQMRVRNTIGWALCLFFLKQVIVVTRQFVC